MEEMEFIVDAAKESMEQAVVHLEKEMLNIRAGKANPIMLSSVKVDYYGTSTLISQVANINSPDGRTLTVQPWEKGMLQEIEKAILVANLGFNPMNNGESIIINIPPLTEERRRDLAKLAKAETENAKIGILSKNCAHWIMSDLAIMLSGHISVPLYPNLNKESLNKILLHSDAQLLFVGKLDNFELMQDGHCVQFGANLP